MFPVWLVIVIIFCFFLIWLLIVKAEKHLFYCGEKKENVVNIYNGNLLSHKKNKSEALLMKWMNLEPVVQSEVS